MILLPVRLRPVYLAAPKNFVVRFHAEPARSPDLAPEAIVRVAAEVTRGEHWNGGSDNISYARALGEFEHGGGPPDVLYAGSRRWAGVQPLIDCGIMRTAARFERFISRGSSSEV